MNSNYGTGDGDQRAWGAPAPGNSSSPFPAWQMFVDWAPGQEYLDAGLPDGNLPGISQEYLEGQLRGSIPEMGPPPSPSLALQDRPQAPKSNPGIPAPQKGRKRQPLEPEWNKHKHKIKDLYITLDLSLKDTMERMEKEHAFFAS